MKLQLRLFTEDLYSKNINLDEIIIYKKDESINWYRLIKETKNAGIVIPVNFKEKGIGPYPIRKERFERKLPFWYDSWDIASGVVWNEKGIKSLKLLYEIIL